MHIDRVTTEQDTSVLWRALMQAKADSDARLVRAIEQRMRELTDERRFAHLTDDELRRQIDGLIGNREPKDMLGHSPGGGNGGDSSDALTTFNDAIRGNQHVGVEVTLAALLRERERRQKPAG